MPTEYYHWNGTPVEVEIHDATNGEIEVHYPPIPHDTGIVPEGETHYLVRLIADSSKGWWATEDSFWEHAEPLSPSAIERVNDLRSLGLYPR